MAARSERRRRVAVALAVIVAAAATIATSPAATPSVGLDRSASAIVVLDADAPRAEGQFVLNLSPELIPVKTEAGVSPLGTVMLSLTSVNGGAGLFTGGPLEVSALAVGGPGAREARTGSPRWDLWELCQLGEACRRPFDVSIEWLQPEPGIAVTVTVEITADVSHSLVESLPSGASEAWEAGQFVNVAPDPRVAARADLGSVTLGRDSPLAVRHVRLLGSAEILNESTVADTAVYVTWEPVADRRVMMTILPDEKTDRWPLYGGTPIQPFAGCPASTPCERGFTIFARWEGITPDDRVDLDWSFEALARFPGSNGIPDGARLTASVDDAIDLGTQSPRLHAQAEGSFDMQPAGDPNATYGQVVLDVLAPAVGNAYLDADPPAVAVVRLSAALKDPMVPAGLKAWVTGGETLGLSSSILADDGTELQAVIFPLVRCRGTPRCAGRVEIRVDGVAGRDATISWGVTVDLPLPRAELATGQLSLQVQGPQQ